MKRLYKLYIQYKIYIFPEKYTKIIDENIINLGTLTTDKLNDYYNKCKIGIIFSNSNPSHVGFEMNSSGLNVIEYDTKFTKYDMDSNIFTKINNSDNIEILIKELIKKESNKYICEKEEIKHFMIIVKIYYQHKHNFELLIKPVSYFNCYSLN